MNVKGKWWSYSYFIRTKTDEGCSDTRLAAEPVPRVSGDRLMMPLAHYISTMGQGFGYAGIKLTIESLSTSCRHGLIGLILDR